MKAAAGHGRLDIAIVGPTYPFRGGIAHYTTLMARHLAERHTVHLISFSRGYPRRLFPGATDRDPSSAPLKAAHAEYLLSPLDPVSWVRTSRRIRELDTGLLVIQWWVPFWAPSLAAVARLAARSGGPPVVFVCHNVLPHDGGGIIDRQLVKLALGAGQGFLVHSAADEAALLRLLPEARVRRGVLPAHTIATLPLRSEARHHIGVPPDAPTALFFGFVRPYKGLDYLLEAVAKSGIPDLHLVVAGEFWTDESETRHRAAALGIAERVVIHNRYIPDEDVGSYFAAADVVVLPYTEASQSGVVTVASGAGLPVIATRVGGLPDVVRDEATGLLVPPRDADALAEAITRIFREKGLYARLHGAVALDRGRFAWPALVEQVEALAADLGVNPRRGHYATGPSTTAAAPTKAE